MTEEKAEPDAESSEWTKVDRRKQKKAKKAEIKQEVRRVGALPQLALFEDVLEYAAII